MIILDTNVLSTLMRRDADPRVIAWLDSQRPDSVWTTTITTFEILPDSRKRSALEEAFSRALEEDLENRVLPVDDTAAEAAARIAAHHRNTGRPVEIRDTLIAGIATARKATLATRNIRHFENTGITTADPWSG